MINILNKPHKWLILLWFVFPFNVAALEFKVEVANENIQANVLAFIQSKTYDCQSVTSTISRQHKDLLALIQTATQPFGYFNAQIKVKTADKSTACESILIEIDLGPLTVINQSQIELVESTDDDFVQLLKKHELQPGQPLKQLKYESLKRQLLNLASEKFYLDATFTEQKIDVYPETNQADINLLFKPGPRYRISSIKIDVDEPFLRPDLIDNMITIKPDQEVTQSQLFQLKQKLNSYGYFNQVLFEIDQADRKNGTVPIIIKLTPAAKYDYSVGLGYSTDSGAKASFKYNNYRSNELGHQFNSHLNLSELSNELAAAYKIPSKNTPATKWFNIQMGYRDEQTDNIDSQTSKLGFSQTRIKNNKWQNINFIDILHETFDTGIEEGESLLVVPGVSWSLTDADNLARPSRGFKIQTEIKAAAEDLLSDASFAQLTLSGKYIHSIGASNRLLYRAQLGATASSDFDELPTTYRFFAGGDQSIRGYDYESISPFNASGDVAGGKHLAVGSIEFEHQFAPQWAAAAFTDFGDAFSSNFDFKYSVGAGVRWFSPIGPIRVDLAVPLDQDRTNFRLHVTIGPDL